MVQSPRRKCLPYVSELAHEHTFRHPGQPRLSVPAAVCQGLPGRSHVPCACTYRCGTDSRPGLRAGLRSRSQSVARHGKARFRRAVRQCLGCQPRQVRYLACHLGHAVQRAHRLGDRRVLRRQHGHLPHPGLLARETRRRVSHRRRVARRHPQRGLRPVGHLRGHSGHSPADRMAEQRAGFRSSAPP